MFREILALNPLRVIFKTFEHVSLHQRSQDSCRFPDSFVKIIANHCSLVLDVVAKTQLDNLIR